MRTTERKIARGGEECALAVIAPVNAGRAALRMNDGMGMDPDQTRECKREAPERWTKFACMASAVLCSTRPVGSATIQRLSLTLNENEKLVCRRCGRVSLALYW